MTVADLRKVVNGVVSPLYGWHLAYGYIFQAWFWRFRFHIFLKEEAGNAYHDHSWGFTTFPLRAYVEQLYDPVTKQESAQVTPSWRLTYRPASHIHRVLGRWSGKGTDVKPGWVPTLVWRGKHEREWRFWRLDGKRVHVFPAARYLKMMESKGDGH